MTDQNKMFETENGNRLPLFEEIGKFFRADGTFDESAFRTIIRQSLKAFSDSCGGDPEKVKAWVSAYVGELISYLDEKKLYDASFLLLRAASEEAERAGIRDISIPSLQLNHIFSRTRYITPVKEEKRISPDMVRNKIFNAALAVFGEKGYHRATMDEIATLSEVGKGTVYRYFRNKEELLNQLLTGHYNEIVDRITQIFSRDQDVLLQIQEMIEFWIQFIQDNQIVYRLIQNEELMQKSGEPTMFYDYLITRLPMFKERILSLNRSKNIKTTSFYSVFYGILGFIDGIVRKWLRKGMSYPLTDEIPIICEVLFNGFVGESNTKKRFYTPPPEKSIEEQKKQ